MSLRHSIHRVSLSSVTRSGHVMIKVRFKLCNNTLQLMKSLSTLLLVATKNPVTALYYHFFRLVLI